MRRNQSLFLRLLSTGLMVVLGISLVIDVFLNIQDTFLKYSVKATGLISAVLGLGVATYFLATVSEDKISYNIAIVGFPRSGKTTLITTLFAAVMYRKIKLNRYNPVLKGNATIERINENITKLEKGVPIGSTTDQTRFSYRINLNTKSKLSSRNYNVEFGDFPGEDTEDFINKETGTWKHESEFFGWIREADAFIFVIDLGTYVLNPIDYKAQISGAIRAAWQNILDFNEKQQNSLRRKPLILVFNKCDILQYYDSSSSRAGSRKIFLDIGFGENGSLPKLSDIDPKDNSSHFFKEKKLVQKAFTNLIRFLEHESANFNVVFISSFMELNEVKYGFQELATSVLPR